MEFEAKLPDSGIFMLLTEGHKGSLIPNLRNVVGLLFAAAPEPTTAVQKAIFQRETCTDSFVVDVESGLVVDLAID